MAPPAAYSTTLATTAADRRKCGLSSSADALRRQPMDHLTYCRQLMDLLTALDPQQYDHTVFRMSPMTRRCCALGHAAKVGIGGLRIGTGSTPWLVDRPQLRVDEACDAVFGPSAWDYVFNAEALNLRL